MIQSNILNACKIFLACMAWSSISCDILFLQKIDMTGMVVIITGASDGLGLETAKSLYGMGAQLVLPVRNLTKGKDAQDAILASSASRHALVPAFHV
jgi:hypothetical protein